MRLAIVIFTIALGALEANAAVECKKDGRYWRPSNEVAKDIAKALKVKTCNGKRFAATVKKLGMKSNVVNAGGFNEAALLKKYKK